MSRLRFVWPYSYKRRSQVILALILVTIMLIMLGGSFFWFRELSRVEAADDEYRVALKLIDLSNTGEFTLEQIIEMIPGGDVYLRRIEQDQLSESEISQLQQGAVYAFNAGGRSPVTLVLTNDGVVEITVPTRNMYMYSSYQRGILIMLMLGGLSSMVALFFSGTITRPISQLTTATRRISEGDFSMRMPEEPNDSELNTLMHSFNKMSDSLQRTATQQKDFIAGVSHEFKTPIASIKGYARLLQMPGIDEEQRNEYTGMIVHEADRLSRLSETLLRLSALEQQSGMTKAETFRLDEQVREVILRQEPIW